MRVQAALDRASGRRRVAIEAVQPEVDCGRFPIKRVIGETVQVEADIFADGHEVISCLLLFRPEGEKDWQQAPLKELGNDRWRGVFRVDRIGRYEYTIEAWVDPFRTWVRDFRRRIEAGQLTGADLQIGAKLIEAAAARARGADRRSLRGWATRIGAADPGKEAGLLVLASELADLVARYPDRSQASRYLRSLLVVVDRERAGFSAWYEIFPRSLADPGAPSGALVDLARELPRIAGLGFDVVYLPPIHPIGVSNRKGRNNTTQLAPGDPGSPWAIGAEEGGHKAIHPQLGDLDDFRSLVAQASALGLEIALDIAFQCSPDHPYTREHPEWFRHRPDGSIQYAENPPKKYEDIYPFDFETPAWPELWNELKSVVLHWIDQGVRIFRVDNPHTKPFAFWEWLISEIKAQHPETIFLSEAFTRPKIMYRLAKLGFTQSYTYFPWRNTAGELRQYHRQLTRGPVREYFRQNAWPNTPDILTEYLQMGGRPAFLVRLVLAATLSANYGIYGPPYEACENRPLALGGEEYLDSEKYQLRSWPKDSPQSISEFISLVNRIRRENPALHSDWNLAFHEADNPQLLCYSKRTEDSSNIVLVVVNLDPHYRQSGWLQLDVAELRFSETDSFQAHDLISGARYLFRGDRNYVSLDPARSPAHIFRLRRRVRTEQDFEYYL